MATIVGPLVGGYITDSLSWRWIFHINMPVGGAPLLALAATVVVLLPTWGGSQYGWARRSSWPELVS